jgi:hypothetical protein
MSRIAKGAALFIAALGLSLVAVVPAFAASAAGQPSPYCSYQVKSCLNH